MNVLIGGRRSGKTRQLLLWMKDAPKGTKRVLIAPNVHMAKLLWAEAERMSISTEDWQFLCPQTSHRLRGRSERIEIGVDQIDFMPPDFDNGFVHPIGFATATQE